MAQITLHDLSETERFGRLLAQALNLGISQEEAGKP